MNMTANNINTTNISFETFEVDDKDKSSSRKSVRNACVVSVVCAVPDILLVCAIGVGWYVRYGVFEPTPIVLYVCVAGMTFVGRRRVGLA
jgi:hypothetical protein